MISQRSHVRTAFSTWRRSSKVYSHHGSAGFSILHILVNDVHQVIRSNGETLHVLHTYIISVRRRKRRFFLKVAYIILPPTHIVTSFPYFRLFLFFKEKSFLLFTTTSRFIVSVRSKKILFLKNTVTLIYIDSVN